MPPSTDSPRFQLCYWPIPFRGCFVSYLFAWCDVPLDEQLSFDAVRAIKDLPPEEQPVPFMGPPVLHDRERGESLSQMPAIVLYAAAELGLTPDTAFAQARCLKVLMDCNDVLMEICRYNGSSMWTRAEWQHFRGERLPHWLRLFEDGLARDHMGTDTVTFADIGVYALFGNLMRCLPQLAEDVRQHAPGIFALCKTIGAKPSLAAYVARDNERFGDQYCGGQIEASIRAMLEQDEHSA